MRHRRKKLLWALTLTVALALPVSVIAQNKEEIESAITEHNKQIEQLNAEIAQYQKQLDATAAKKNTLQGTLNDLNVSIKKVTSSVTLTKTQISATQLQIAQLQGGIEDKQASIETNQAGLAESLRLMDAAENQSLAAQLLAAGSISNAWEDVDNYQTIQGAVRAQIDNLAKEKQQLTDVKTQRENKEKDLQAQRTELVTQQGALNATKKAQTDLLSQTKSQEATYQKILAEKRAQQKSFEDALNDLQSQLQVAVSQSDITPAGKGILRWPTDNVRISQYFGNTAFAKSGAYNGKGHNGIDLAAPTGTPIKAALGGTVIGSGNTDSVRGCYSFGKWVMVKHSNGLSTMYSHLSQISTYNGATVASGDVLGYSGETGYATGPHLHFGVYVSSATQIIKLGSATKSTTPCANAVMPVAPLEGYLNPLNYL
jgi:murein DD-endopeptidase MepM/ murein hydrolase activator NlpD